MNPELFHLHSEIELTHWWFVGRRAILGALVRELLGRERGTVVDIGCGTGANIASLSGDYRCLGVDTTPAAIDLARSRHPSVEFRLGAAPAVIGDMYPAADAFLMMDVLEHLEDDASTLAELVRPMRRGAVFLITVPADMRLWSTHDVSFGHHRRYDRESLGALWSGLPVTTLLLSHFSARLYPAVRAVRAITRATGGTFGSRGTDFAVPPPPVNGLLTRLFAGESARLVRAMRGDARPYARGSSLVAILRRT